MAKHQRRRIERSARNAPTVYYPIESVDSPRVPVVSATHFDERFPRVGRPLLAAIALLVMGLVAYIPALRCGYIWDDDAHVTENVTLKSTAGLSRMWLTPRSIPQYYPLVHTTFWVEWHLWGLSPAGYHLDNVLLHITTALLLWRVLLKLGVPGAWLAAALFVVHPVHVESVAWVTERKNVLSGALYLGALLAYLTWRPIRDDSDESASSNWRYLLALVLFAGALLSKTVTATLPAAILLLTWWKNGHVRRRDVLPLLPMFLLGLVLGSHTSGLEKDHVGALGAEWNLSFLDRSLIAGRAVWFYVGKLVFPYPLTFIYPRWQVDPSRFWQYLFPLAAVALLLALWMFRRKLGRGPLVAALFFGGTLLPALCFFNYYAMVYSFVADHLQYLASLGPLVLFAAGGATFAARHPALRPVWLSGMAAVLLGLGILCWQQQSIYQNAETLWLDTIDKNPQSWLAHNNLGCILQDRGQTAEAIRHFRESLHWKSNYAPALSNLGNALITQGRAADAIPYCREAVRLKPTFAEAHNNLGYALLDAGEINEAIDHYREAVRLNPDFGLAHNNLGFALHRQDQNEEAITQFREALWIDPNLALAHINLADVLAIQGETSQAVRHYREALRLRPKDVKTRNSLGIALAQQGELDLAGDQFRQVIQLDPKSADAHNNLGVVRLRQNRLPEAQSEFEQALALQPKYPDAQQNLAQVRAKLKDAGRNKP